MEKSFFISPNPAKNYLTVWFKKNSVKNRVTITDVLGRKMMEKEFNQNGSAITIDISAFKPDLYFISVNGQTLKFVKD